MGLEQEIERSEFGQRLRRAREASGYTIAAFAWAAGISDEALRRFETGERSPKLETAMRMSAALGVSLEDLLPEGYLERLRPPGQVLEWLGRRSELPQGASARQHGDANAVRAGGTTSRPSSSRRSLTNASSLADSKRTRRDQGRKKPGRKRREGGFRTMPLRPAA